MRQTEAEISELRDAATNALKLAYCPYSKFPVGAAVLVAEGKIFSGCNVENASYGLTICAERNAIFKAVSEGYLRLRTLAIASNSNSPTFPCGACRQVINEFGNDIEIYCFPKGGEVYRTNIMKLLPNSFGPGDLP